MAETDSDLSFWTALDRLVAGSRVVIDRPSGSHHPRYPDLVYPLDYGYLENTTSMDGGGIDVWKGSIRPGSIDAVMVTVDLTKKDSEIKLLIGCTESEMETVLRFHNTGRMKGVMVRRQAY